MNSNEKSVIHIKDILKSLNVVPKTVKLITRLEGGLFYAIMLLSIVLGIIPVISVAISQKLINMLILRNSGADPVIGILVTYIALNLITLILSVLLEYCEAKIQYKFQYKLNYEVMQRCANLKYADFENAEVYDKIEKINNEIGIKPYTIMISIITFVTASITMVSSIGYLFSWNVIAAVVLLLIPAFSLVYFLRIGEKEFQMHWKRAMDERKTWYLSYILTHDFSYKEVYLYDFKDYILKKYWNLSKKFIKQNDKILISKNLFTFLYEAVVLGVSSIIIGFAVWSAYLGKLLAGNVMAYIKSISLVQSNSQQIMTNIYTLYNSALYMNMLFEFFEYAPLEKEEDDNAEQIHELDIQKLNFRYPNGTENAITNLDLQLKEGEKLAIVGPNGSGKSTFIKIITGLYDLESGQIKINGKEIKNLTPYKKHMAVLFQDFVKYELTLRENVAMGRKLQNGDEYMKQILDIIHADFVKEGDDYNLDKQLGVWFEGGVQLSQGQWQKIALARAYFKEASLFILDEPNSALDPISEKEVFDSFFELAKDKIGVYISHKLNAAKRADKIIVMEKGTIVGVGRHEELLKSCKTYQELYKAECYQE